MLVRLNVHHILDTNIRSKIRHAKLYASVLRRSRYTHGTLFVDKTLLYTHNQVHLIVTKTKAAI